MSSTKKKFKLKHYINYIGVALALVVLLILANNGSLSRSTMGLLPKIGYSIILAVSLNLVVGFLGELSLGHAGFMCVGAYLGSYFSIFIHSYIDNDIICLFLSMLVGGLVAAFFGFIIGLPALRLKGDYLAIVTLAFGEIVRNIFKNLDVFGGALGLKTSKIKFNSAKDTTLFVVTFIVLLVVLYFIQNLIRSKHGRAITAIRDNEIAAKAMGINVTYYKLFVFTIAAFFAGIAGVIYGHSTTPIMYSNFDYNYSIEILVMVVIGGIGSISGSIVAATGITIINSVLQNKLTGDMSALRLLVYALILIIVVIFTNAPALKPIKEKLSIKNIFKSKKADVISDDDAAWNRIETKIKMDELLSTDVANVNKAYTPDKSSNSGKDGK